MPAPIKNAAGERRTAAVGCTASSLHITQSNRGRLTTKRRCQGHQYRGCARLKSIHGHPQRFLWDVCAIIEQVVQTNRGSPVCLSVCPQLSSCCLPRDHYQGKGMRSSGTLTVQNRKALISKWANEVHLLNQHLFEN